MTQTSTPAPSFNREIAEATWTMMTAHERNQWITSIIGNQDRISDADCGAWADFLADKLV